MAGPANYTFQEALNAYNKDPVFTQTMWHITPSGKSTCPSWHLLQEMQIYGQGFEAPSRSNEFGEVQYRGYKIPVPTVPAMTQEHSMTINADAQQRLRRLFLDCVNATIDADGIKAMYPSFAADRRPTEGIGGQELELSLLGSDYMTVMECIHFVGVRVSEVGTMSLSNTDGGVASFSVNFKSVYWHFDDSPSLAMPAIGTGV